MTEEHRCTPPPRPLDGQRWRCPGCSGRLIGHLPRGADPELPGSVQWIEDLDVPLLPGMGGAS